MTSFLFIVSFLLHIISIAAIYTLSKQLSMNKDKDSSEIISLMEDYLEEIKEENRFLQQELSNSPIKVKEAQGSPVTEDKPSSIESDEFLDAAPIPLGSDQVKDEIEVSLPAKILKLYKEGVELEEIARRLGCGKTEVELIIKFQEKSNI